MSYTLCKYIFSQIELNHFNLFLYKIHEVMSLDSLLFQSDNSVQLVQKSQHVDLQVTAMMDIKYNLYHVKKAH